MTQRPAPRTGKADAAGLFQTRTFSAIAADVLRDRIMTGVLATGARLNEVALADELRISRPPIREALRVLAGEGLVELIPGRGAFVVRPDRTSIRHLGEVRLALERATARYAAERADDDDRALLRRLMDETEKELSGTGKPYPHRIEFHAALTEAAHNPRLADLLGEVIRQMRLASIRSNEDPARAREVLHEHRALTEAILRRDADEAEHVMHDHIEATTRAILTVLDAEAALTGEKEDGRT
ncbi:GntR family transcriptional regulator [Yinghuangia sp. ASG 101]|uniref:GntR family transcriptional regulator n=1 Tax=Yinghuangia sp. ASG 101 TaxID=2896848 RepID=UPI001E43C827|nr:GntR family transcriptional regulator [Yinghuangia sp. ASG 101]UGQ13371.1 GntR family transcriptional regulator [Yinghuangia sp. ASG 101]